MNVAHYSSSRRACFLMTKASYATGIRQISLSSRAHWRPLISVSFNYARPFSTSPKAFQDNNNSFNPLTKKFGFPDLQGIDIVKSATRKPSLNPEKVWEERNLEVAADMAGVPKTNKYSGRTVEVRNDRVPEAFHRLAGILKRNNVRKVVRLQQRHEKKGVKRRRLESQRWRRRFSDEVRQRVLLVNQIRRRGV